MVGEKKLISDLRGWAKKSICAGGGMGGMKKVNLLNSN